MVRCRVFKLQPFPCAMSSKLASTKPRFEPDQYALRMNHRNSFVALLDISGRCARSPRRTSTYPGLRFFELSVCMHIALHEVSCPLRPPSLDFSPQLPTLSHPSSLLLRTIEFRNLGIARGSL